MATTVEERLSEVTGRYLKALRELRLAELDYIKEKTRLLSPALSLLDFTEIGEIPVPPNTIARIRMTREGGLEASVRNAGGRLFEWVPESVLSIRETSALQGVLEQILEDPVNGYTTFEGIIRRI